MVFNMFVRAKSSAGRIDEVFTSRIPLLGKSGHGSNIEKGRIEFENVTFSYEGQQVSRVKKY